MSPSSVLVLEHAFRDIAGRRFAILVSMGPGDQPVEIDSSDLVFGQNDRMVTSAVF